jgi:2-phospho-L-lactate guanylyltransferase
VEQRLDGPLWAILPVKPFAEAKTRLGGVLTPAQRDSFVRHGLVRTLGVLQGITALHQRLVVSRDTAALAMARGLGSETFAEESPGGLNEALAAATKHALATGAGAVLVVATDLPLLAAHEVEELIARSEGHAIVIAPDRRMEGTNALLMRPPGVIDFAFGPGSLRAHSSLARSAGFVANVFISRGFADDLDLPEDLIELQQQGWNLPEVAFPG